MKVAVLGLGAMGSRIARRLLDGGNDVLVWNRTREKAEGFPRVAASPAEAAAEADVTITMLTDAGALREVTQDIRPRTLIEMSTVGPDAVRELAARLPEVIDAPVLGSRSEAEAGTLHIFVGGTAEQYARCSPLLSVLGTPHHVGPVGAGAAAKLVANSTLIGTIAVLGEALRLADRLGLSREAAFDVLSVSPLAAQAERRRPALEANDFPPRFALALARKDADLVSGAAPDLRVARAAGSWFADADAAWGERDYSAVLAWLLDVPDEQQDQRNDQDDEQPVADGNPADDGEDDQQQDQ